MDSVELARQVAAELHARLVASGADPWSPYDFAVAEARRRGIDVEPTAAGAAVLNGGRATFVTDDDLILHENVGSRFEQAFLVAHEIGHAELGDDPEGEPVPAIDPSRAAEPSPVGMDRVVDYGRRQRREVQMDLFARELLLPRPLVRTLHIDEGLSASAIAAKLGAPFEMVAQQLFDALLLPPVPPVTAATHIERPLNSLQASAAAHRGEAYLLEASPGTGKTQTLIARVEGLLEEGVDPRRLLLLTFSNKAAGEMAERIARKRPEAAAAMWIGTFHAFGLDIIRRFHAELGLPKDPRMMDRTEAAELLEEEFPRLRLTHYRNLYDPTQIIADMLAAVSRAKDEVVDAEAYAALAGAMLAKAGDSDTRDVAERAGEVARVYAGYEQLKRNAHCIDFGDLVALPVRRAVDDVLETMEDVEQRRRAQLSVAQDLRHVEPDNGFREIDQIDGIVEKPAPVLRVEPGLYARRQIIHPRHERAPQDFRQQVEGPLFARYLVDHVDGGVDDAHLALNATGSGHIHPVINERTLFRRPAR
ncbi:UvrD-helicase domain-containing protein [Mesorhizobium comanense]|uniref:UvrD-helicase domain-containing protein n=1 Tax=Mesorhizobium comanense TaxID=2502215 RepID=UPI0038CC0EB2